MTRDLPLFRRFLGRVHRRLVAARVVEAGGIGLLAGSGFAIALGLVLLLLGRPAAPAVATLLVLGTLCGVVATLFRRPVMLQTALQADRQLDLADLLSTALVIDERSSPADAWACVVTAAANARCAQLSPSQVISRRFSGRAWGGIAVMALLALTLAAFSAGSADALAGRGPLPQRPGSSLVAAHLAPLPGTNPPPARTAERVARRRTWSDSEDRNHSSAAGRTGTEIRPEDAQPAPEPFDPPEPGASDSAGSGSAMSSAKPIVGARSAPPPRDAGEPATSPATQGSPAGGSGTSGDDRPASAATPLGGGGGASHATRPAPPWRTVGWPTDAKSAREAISAGRVPEAYRDVVRDYFDRP